MLLALLSKASAWSTAGQILGSPEAALESKLFAAQTFKSKVSYRFNSNTSGTPII